MSDQMTANSIRDSAKTSGGEDNTTAQRDTTKSTEKAKRDHPEAPDVVIGMQDERGTLFQHADFFHICYMRFGRRNAPSWYSRL